MFQLIYDMLQPIWHFFSCSLVDSVSICMSADLPCYFCYHNSTKYINQHMLSECKGRNKHQHCDSFRQISIPLWNIFTFSKPYTAKPARHTVNGRKQINRLVNPVQETNCTSKDVTTCKFRSCICSWEKYKTDKTDQPRIKVSSKKLIPVFLFLRRNE